MNTGAMSAIAVIVKSIIQDNRRPLFNNNVNVIKNAGTSITEMFELENTNIMLLIISICV